MTIVLIHCQQAPPPSLKDGYIILGSVAPIFQSFIQIFFEIALEL